MSILPLILGAVEAATEHEVLVALCAAIDDAKQRPCTKQKPVKWAVCDLTALYSPDIMQCFPITFTFEFSGVRWPETQAAWKTVVAYPKDSTDFKVH